MLAHWLLRSVSGLTPLGRDAGQGAHPKSFPPTCCGRQTRKLKAFWPCLGCGGAVCSHRGAASTGSESQGRERMKHTHDAVVVAVTIAASAFTHLFVIAGTSQAQWSVTRLHPLGSPPEASHSSHAYSVNGGLQAGDAEGHASIWSGSAVSLVDLNPSGALSSVAFGTSGGQQVGRAWLLNPSNDATPHASLWSGSAASWIDLNPAGWDWGSAFGVDGGQQVGRVSVGGPGGAHASLWTGTAASWIDLNPPDATTSEASAVGGGQQVGGAAGPWSGGVPHASLWNGTAASWIDLDPGGASSLGSWAYGVGDGQQVGYATVGGLHAALWSGTAASWIDLNPLGALGSVANDVSGGMQVGYANFAGIERAGVWGGTAASWIDLHAFLPAGFSASYAQGIWSDADHVYVSGYGRDAASGIEEALLWTLPIPAPTGGGVILLAGLIAGRRSRQGTHCV